VQESVNLIQLKNEPSHSNDEIKINLDKLPNPQDISFDIAITTSDSKGIKGGMGIFVADAGIGYKASKGKSGSEVSRIKFEIPIVFPPQIDTQEK
jgi:hypothetical protein